MNELKFKIKQNLTNYYNRWIRNRMINNKLNRNQTKRKEWYKNEE